MAFTNGQSVLACLRTQNTLLVGESDTGKRIHRATIGTANEWNTGDTVKVKQAAGAYKFFGYGHADDLTDEIILTREDGTIIASSTSGQGTDDVTVTLDEAGVAGEDVVVCYRAGIAATYVVKGEDRKHAKLDRHEVTLDGGAHDYTDLFGEDHPKAGAGATVKSAGVYLDGMSIQTVPPA